LKVGPPRLKKGAAAAATGVAGTIRHPKNEKGVDDLLGRNELLMMPTVCCAWNTQTQ